MEWISIDTPPMDEGRYLIWAIHQDSDCPLIQLAWWTGERWDGVFPIWIEAMTHWMEVEAPNDN